jgi:integrase
VKALRPAPAGKRYTLMEAETPGFGVRVTDSGHAAFIYGDRFPNKPAYTFRQIAPVNEVSLADARATAQAWRKLVRAGVDPADEKKRAVLETAKKRKNTFAAVLVDFIEQKLSTERKGSEVALSLQNELLPKWGDRPIVDIADDDVRGYIKGKKSKAPAQARNMLGYIRRMFAWAIDEAAYGIKKNPCAELKASKLLPVKKSRNRILSDDELFAAWRAARRMPYPHGPAFQLLLLTALRLNEAVDGRRREFDFSNGVWVIPAERMKGTDSAAREHVVPITNAIRNVIDALPVYKKGDFLFSTTFGETPAWITSKVKQRLDRRMLHTLRALARSRGEDPAKVDLPPFVNHDIRRTIRSGLSALRIDRDIREAVLAHARPGVEGTYDRYDYLPEKRDALERWATRLTSMGQPASPSKVIRLRTGIAAAS